MRRKMGLSRPLSQQASNIVDDFVFALAACQPERRQSVICCTIHVAIARAPSAVFKNQNHFTERAKGKRLCVETLTSFLRPTKIFWKLETAYDLAATLIALVTAPILSRLVKRFESSMNITFSKRLRSWLV